MTARPRASALPLLALLASTAVWGSTFFLIKDLVVRIPALDLLALRFGIGAVALAAIAGRRLRMPRQVAVRGVLLGVLYGGAQILQTLGLAQTSASVAGFITGLYVVATPLLGAWILRTRIPLPVWIAVGLATIGLGALSLNGFSVGYGALLTLASAVVYAGHILATGRFAEPGAVLGLSLVQMATITVLCGLVGLWPTATSGAGITLPSGGHDWLVLLYLGLVASALTSVLQTWGQSRIEPTRAAVVMSLEPVWAAATAVLLGGESLTLRMVLGGLAILAAMYLVELTPGRKPVTTSPGPSVATESAV